MRRPSFVLALALVVALAGCAKKPTAPPSMQTGLSISGAVRVGTAPVANAAVSLSGASTALVGTGADGSYSFTGLSSGSYLVHVQHSGYSMSPSGSWVDLSSGSVTNIDFRLTPTLTRFDLTGTISGTGNSGVHMTLAGDNAGNALSLPDGSWSIPNLIIGDYTLTPEKAGYHFAPPSRTVQGTISFTHPQTGSGTLGSVTIGSIKQGTNDVSGFFDITSPPTDGVGTIRVRRASEIAPGNIAAYNALWSEAGVVLVLVDTALGAYGIQVHLGPYPTIIATSTSFLLSQTLTPSNGNDFTALAH